MSCIFFLMYLIFLFFFLAYCVLFRKIFNTLTTFKKTANFPYKQRIAIKFVFFSKGILREHIFVIVTFTNYRTNTFLTTSWEKFQRVLRNNHVSQQPVESIVGSCWSLAFHKLKITVETPWTRLRFGSFCFTSYLPQWVI